MKIKLLSKSDIKSSSALKSHEHPNIIDAFAIQATDFAVLTGAIIDKELPNDKQYAKYIWTTASCQRQVEVDYGTFDYDVVMDISSTRAMWANSRESCILPVVDLEEAKKEKDFEIIHSTRFNSSKSVKIAQVGAYPQSLADVEVSAKLTRALKRNQLTETGKTYTVNALPMPLYTKDMEKQEYSSLKEYEFEGEKYVQVIASLPQTEDETKDKIHLKASNRTIKNKKPYWIKVEPLTWLIDEKKGILISQKAILSGIRFDEQEEYKGNFSQTEMQMFCKKRLSNEINNQIKINLNNFKSFILGQLKNEIASMQRIKYFQQLLLLTKSYLGKSITGADLSQTEQNIVNYTKKHIQDMTTQQTATPKEMLNQFTQKTEETKSGKNKNISPLLRLREIFFRN